MNFLKRAVLVIAAAVWTALPAAVAQAEPLVNYEDGMLSLEVSDMPLRDILEVFSRQGIRVYVGHGVNPNISARFSDRPVEDAFNVLLKGLDYSLVWRKRSSGEAVYLDQIQVFECGKASALHRIGSGHLDVVAGNDHRLMIRDTVLLIFKQGVPRDAVAALVARYRGSIVEYDGKQGLARIRLPEGSNPDTVSGKMAESPLVSIAEPDYVYGLPRLAGIGGISLAKGRVETGSTADSAVIVAVLDSGLAPRYADSQFLAGAYDALSPTQPIADDSGHGTQMALLAAGIVDPLGIGQEAANSASVLAVKAFDQNGYTSTSALMNGIKYALEAGARVVSMSWGSATESRVLESVVDYAADQGLILVAAAGNEPTGLPVYPAAYDSVIGIGALMPDGEVWPQSNFGSFVDYSFPGLAVFSEGSAGTSSMYAGTSISTAYASRLIAEIIEDNPDIERDQIIEKLSRGY